MHFQLVFPSGNRCSPATIIRETSNQKFRNGKYLFFQQNFYPPSPFFTSPPPHIVQFKKSFIYVQYFAMVAAGRAKRVLVKFTPDDEKRKADDL